MAVDSMITEGLYLMMVGMGFVVCFLTILVLLLNLMEKLIGQEDIEVATAVTGSTQQMDNSRLMAVISAAVHQHRQQSKNK